MTIQIFEFQKISIGEQSLSNAHFKALVKYNEANGNKYFEVGHNSIKAKSYVGLIQVGTLTLKILPKIGNTTYDEKIWESALIEMLQRTQKLRLSSPSAALLSYGNLNVLELLARYFLTELDYHLRQGLIKQYRRKEDNILALKGKIKFPKHIQQNFIHAERFYTEHQVYDYSHKLNQILYAALNVLDRLKLPHLQDYVGRLKLQFPEIEPKRIVEKDFDTIKESRKTLPFKNILALAKMIILNYSPSLYNGQEGIFSLLFPMEKLWEEYVYQQLRLEAVSTSTTRVYPSRVKTLFTFKSHKTKILKTDIFLIHKGQNVVIDTKWKHFKVNEIPSDADLKQMLLYALYWEANHLILFYPKSKGMVKSIAGTYEKFYSINGIKLTCIGMPLFDSSKKLNVKDILLILDSHGALPV